MSEIVSAGALSTGIEYEDNELFQFPKWMTGTDRNLEGDMIRLDPSRLIIRRAIKSRHFEKNQDSYEFSHSLSDVYWLCRRD